MKLAAWTVLGAPLYTLAAYQGMGLGPEALRKAGVSAGLDAIDLGDVKVGTLPSDVVEGGAKNMDHFVRGSREIRRATRSLHSENVLVLGGECSVAVGAASGLVGAFGGRAGMLWMDAHGDFNVPATSPSGYIGGMCLAMACGRGPDLGVWEGTEGPPLAEERLVHVGSRDLDQPEVLAFNSSQARLFTAQQVKKGAGEVAEEAARHLDSISDWVICHVDVDVVDPEVIPAVNYPTPGGLSLGEVAQVVKAMDRTGKLKVLELTSYNRLKDQDGSSAMKVAELAKAIIR